MQEIVKCQKREKEEFIWLLLHSNSGWSPALALAYRSPLSCFAGGRAGSARQEERAVERGTDDDGARRDGNAVDDSGRAHQEQLLKLSRGDVATSFWLFAPGAGGTAKERHGNHQIITSRIFFSIRAPRLHPTVKQVASAAIRSTVAPPTT